MNGNPFGLTIDVAPTPAREWAEAQAELYNISHVHGTNSNALTGLAQFKTILTMSQIMHNRVLGRPGQLKSGERGNTILAANMEGRQPIANGISMYEISDIEDCISYANMRNAGDSNCYPMIYAIKNLDESRLNRRVREHPLSIGCLRIEDISFIWVPQDKVYLAHRTLRCYEERCGISEYAENALSPRVKAAPPFILRARR